MLGKNKEQQPTNRFVRRSINLDEANFTRCRMLAADLAVSVSGLIRLLIKQAYNKHVGFSQQDDSQS
jgi:hypothetical protein